jgi:hypothetical protein
MKRRTFLTAVATLVSWFTMRPKVHADAINASPETTERPGTARILIWDGSTLVEGLSIPETDRRGEFIMTPSLAWDGRRWFSFTDAIDNALGVTCFRHRYTYVDQLAQFTPKMFVNYEYVSGPKWWEQENILAYIDNGWTCPKCGIHYSEGPPWPRKPYCECGFMGSIRISREEMEASRRLTPGESWRRAQS